MHESRQKKIRLIFAPATRICSKEIPYLREQGFENQLAVKQWATIMIHYGNGTL